eukprot:COSAG05_NODE_18418_length_309_cov_0.361905_1_plen_24_part_10
MTLRMPLPFLPFFKAKEAFRSDWS